MKKNIKKKNSVMLLLVLLLAISVGFAVLATTLKINGSTNITKQTWDIYWDNVANQKGVTTTKPTITADGNVAKSLVSWTVTLNKPGDFYEFTVDAVNAGTLDAMITNIDYKLNGATMSNENKLPSYIKYSVTYDDGIDIALNQMLPKATTTPTKETYKVRIEYDKELVENSDVNNQADNLTYDLAFSVTYGQATNNAVLKPVFILPVGKTKDNLQVGDELCAKGQCFNFVRYDGDNIVMFAKYNLNVGEYAKDSETFMQDSEVFGWKNSLPNFGKTKYSKTNYWHDTNTGTVKSQYGDSYPADVYDSDNYKNSDPTNDNFSIAYYVERYKTLLTEMGIRVDSARLLTFDEAKNNIGCYNSGSYYVCPEINDNAKFFATSFWLGTAAASDIEMCIDASGNLWSSYNCNYGPGYGVRPVIVVEKNKL